MNKKFFTIIFLVTGIFYFTMISAASLSPVEQQIKNYIFEQKAPALSLLEKLVNINSGTANVAGAYKIGEILRPQFEQLGFKTRWATEPANMRRAGTFIAERKGSQGERILLIGHLDTVFPINSPFQHFKNLGKTAAGPGVIDDKGGDIVILYALKALNAVHALDNTTITVVLTGDEEESGKPTSISRLPLKEVAKHSDIALDFEFSTDLNKATIARRGVSDWMIETQGKQAHSAGIFQKYTGDGAIFELARILNTIRSQLSKEKYFTFNPGIILGGTKIDYNKNTSQGSADGKTNVIAKTALARGDFRFLTETQQKLAEEKMSVITEQHLPGTSATIHFQDGIPTMSPTANNLQLLQKYSQASIDLGYAAVTPIDPGLRGAADISYVAGIVAANLSGLGPCGSGAHSINEILEISSLPIATSRAALLIYRLTRNH